MLKFWVGLVVGVGLVPVAGMLYLFVGHPPVAVADHPFPFERQIVKVPLHARIRRDMPASSPLQPTAVNLTAGAQTYIQQCSECHGVKGRRSDFGPHMYPPAPQLWYAHGSHGVVGVSDDPVGETYWKISNGIRLTGMPSYNKVLSSTQMWQIALLLKSANRPMPAAADALLQPTPAAASGQSQATK